MGGTYNYSSTNITYGMASNWTPNGVPTPSDYPFIGSYTVTDTSDLSTTLGGYFCFYNKANVTVNGSVIIAVAGSSTGNIVETGATLNVKDALTLAPNAGSSGALTITGSDTDVDAKTVTIGVAGSGTISVAGGAGLVISGATMLGSKNGSSGTLNLTAPGGVTTVVNAMSMNIGVQGSGQVTVSGDGSQIGSSLLKVTTLTVGGKKATVANNQVTYSGGSGTLQISNQGAVDDSGGLSLLGGTISFLNGGSMTVGFNGGSPSSGTLQINTQLVGWGQIDSDSSGTTLVGNSLKVPVYNLNVVDSGTIEAKNGTLTIQGNVTGGGIAKIDANATLELGGTFQGTVQFSNNGPGTLILDNPKAVAHQSQSNPLNIQGLQAGDSIVLENTTPEDGDGLIGVTIGPMGSATGQTTLQIIEGTNLGNAPSLVLNIPLLDAPANLVTQDSFKVTQDGNNTVLTLAPGTSIAQAVNAPAANSSGYTGAGITVAIISGDFGTPAEIASDQSIGALPANVKILGQGNIPLGGEGLAMAEVVHAIAPGANIDFYTGLPGSEDTLALAINQIRALDPNVNVIVSDVGTPGMPLPNGLAQTAINKAAAAGITYIASSGNLLTVATSSEPNVIAVGAANWLATPYGGYLTDQPEPFNKGTPSILAPDAGSDTLALNATAPYMAENPGVGTSFAAPAVAGVVALMLSKDPVLKPNQPPGSPSTPNVTSILTSTATSFPGTNLVNAVAAVAATPLVTAFKKAPDPATPTVVSAFLSQPAGDADTGLTVHFSVTLAEGVTVTGGTPTLSLNSGSTTASYDANASNPAMGNLVFDYTIGANDRSANLAITGYNANGATVQDAADNNLDLSLLFNAPTGLTINSPLSVKGVTAAVSSQPNSTDAETGQAVQIVLTLNEALTLNSAGGNPTLTLSDNETATFDASHSNLAAGTLAFDYTVASGDETSNLSVYAVNLPSGTTITDSNGNNADFSGVSSFNTGLVVGPAYVDNYTTTQGTAFYSGQLLQLTLDMSGDVTVTGTPQLTFDDGASASYDINASDPSSGTLVFDYMVGASDRSPDLYVTGISGGTITDSFGNAADLTGIIDIPTGLQIGPLVVASVTSSLTGDADTGTTVELTLQMSNPVTVNTASGSPTLTLNDNATATYDADNSDPANGTLVFDYTVGASDQTPDLEITQVNPNGATIQDSDGVNVDLSAAINAPTGLSINSPLKANLIFPTNASGDVLLTGQTLDIEVELSKDVTVDTAGGSPILLMNSGGTATYDAAASYPQFGDLVFDYTVGANDYNAALAIDGLDLNGATITDASGNNPDPSSFVDTLGYGSFSTPIFVNPAYVVSGSSPTPGLVQAGQAVQLVVNMSAGVIVDTSGGTPTLSVSANGDTATYDSNASDPAAGKLVFDFTAAGRGDSLAVGAISLNGATITDDNGNPALLQGLSSNPLSFGVTDGQPQVTTVFESYNDQNVAEAATGQTIQIVLSTSDTNLTVTGAPTLSLNDGATATYNTAESDLSAGSLTFDYTVGANDATYTLLATQLKLNGGSIEDANGASLSTSLSATLSQQAQDAASINKSSNHALSASIAGPPFILDGEPASLKPPEWTTGQTSEITLTTSDYEMINTTNGSPTLTLSDGATATYDASLSFPNGSGVAEDTLVFDYVVGSNDISSGLSITRYNANGSVVTGAFDSVVGDLTNAAGLPVDVSQSPGLDVTINVPVVASVTTSATASSLHTGQSFTLAVFTSQAVTITGGSPTLKLNDGGVATYDSAASNLAEGMLVFDYTIAASDATQDLAISQFNPNGATIKNSMGQNALWTAPALQTPLGIEVNVPQLVSIVPSQTSPLPAGGSMTITVTMSAPLTVNTAGGSPTLSLDDGSMATYDVNASTPSAGKLVFDYTAAASDYTPDLTVVDFNLNGAVVQGTNGMNGDFSNAVQGLSVVVNAAAALGVPPTPTDFYGSGTSDILFRSDASGDTGFYQISNGANVGWQDVDGSSTAYSVVGTGDFYGTGTTDILYRDNASGDTGFYQINNGVNVGWQHIGGSSTAYNVVGVADFYGNGTDDVLFRNNATGDTGFYEIVNGAKTGWVDVDGSSTAYSVVGTGDFMGNGTDDILFRDNSTGDTGFYNIVNGVNTGWVDVGGSSTAYSVVGTGDFMGNGTDDILFRDNSTGDIGFYDIVNGVNTAWYDIGGSSSAYSVVATGDYLGNGSSDILFRNNATGDTGFYAISNGVNIGWHDVGGSSTAYHVAS